MRKGQYEGIEIVFALLFLTIVIFIMMFLFVANRGKIGEEKLSSIKVSENNLLLLNYLRTPIKYDGENILISDLIVLKDRDKLEEETKKIFDKYCNDKCVWKITLDYGSDKEVISKLSNNFISTSLNEFVLSGYDNDIRITLEFGYEQRIRSYSKLRY